MSTDIYFGIDFGTTNSSVARYDPKKGEAKIVLNADGEEKTPSLVYFGEGAEILVGQDVVNLLEEAENSDDQAERDDINLRVVKAIKREFTNPVVPIPGGKTVRPVEVVAEILKKLKRDAEEGYFHDKIARVVLTYPATFGAREQKVLREAATLAGFGEVELIEEPTAAAIAFSRLGRKVGSGVLVYDLGAGTFDLSMVTRDEEGSFYVSMEPQGDPRCGGNDFDLALYRYCDEIARKELGRPISLSEETDLAFLGQCCKRKENLSSREKSRFGSYLPSEDGMVRFRHEVLREDFEDLIRGRVEETVRKTGSMLDRAKAQGHVVDAVVLVGGSSRVPLVKQRLKADLPVEPVDFSEKDYAVALGAAYHAYEMWKPAPKLDPRVEYRKAVEAEFEHPEWMMAWGGTVGVLRLSSQASELGLSTSEAADIEREVLGDTKEAIQAEQEEARKLAQTHDIDVSGWQGTGKGDRVTKRDVEAYVEEQERKEKERRASDKRLREELHRPAKECRERFDREWGSPDRSLGRPEGQKRRELVEGIKRVTMQGKQSIRMALQPRGHIAAAQRVRIEEVESLEQAEELNKTMPDEVFAATAKEWRKVGELAQRRCVELLEPFLDAPMSMPRDFGTLDVTMPQRKLVMQSGYPPIILDPVLTPLLIKAYVSGWMSKKSRITDAKQKLRQNLDELLLHVRRQLLDVDVETGRDGMVDEYFTALERAARDQVQEIAQQKEKEAKAEFSRLVEIAKSNYQQRKEGIGETTDIG